jgi:hypothetical protein
MAVLIVALSLGLVVTMARHREEVTRLRAMAERERAQAAYAQAVAAVLQLQVHKAESAVQSEVDATAKALESLKAEIAQEKALETELRLRRTQRGLFLDAPNPEQTRALSPDP